MFFDAFPRFYRKSSTSTAPARLNMRWEAIVGENRDLFRGARVLDIASHDGRWSLAALEAGAAHVIGVEARGDLVEVAEELVGYYVADRSRYRFIHGDVFDVLATEPIEADLVLCLGFLYHTLRYNELLTLIRRINPRHLIIDTQVLKKAKRPILRLSSEFVVEQRNAAEDAYAYRGRAVVGEPSVAALEVLLDAYDFEIERFSDWGSLLRDNSLLGVPDYARRHRITARVVSRPPP